MKGRKDMKIDIRNSIYQNFKGADANEFRTCIEDSIADGKEVTLPGLGVLFEALWSKIDNKKKDDILNILVAYYQ